MFTHVFVGSNDIERSRRFYDAVMSTLGYKNVLPPEAPKLIYAAPGSTFIVGQPIDGNPATFGNGGTLGFAAASDEEVEAWHQAGLANGGTCDGLPGPRDGAPNRSVGAYLRDPDGNKVCAFHMRH